jgi:hypothetical protein
VLFLYIHVNYQYKKSEDLDIYEFEYTDMKTLQETCDVRQPIVFYFAPLIGKYAPINLEVLQAVEKEDGNILNIKDVHDYYKVLNSSSILPIKVPLSFQSVVQLIHADTATPHFFSENNHEFVEETGIDSVMTKIGNRFLRPSCSVNQTFDFMTASKGVGLPMRFHTQTRKYIHVSSGRIVVKMAPFKYAKKLDFNKQFLVSPMNCWKPQLQYIPYINKVRFLEFEVLEGYMLYIPPYWIYSIFYVENNTCLLEYNYRTAMNMVAHPDGVVRSFKNVLQVLVNIVDSFGSGGGGGGLAPVGGGGYASEINNKYIAVSNKPITHGTKSANNSIEEDDTDNSVVKENDDIEEDELKENTAIAGANKNQTVLDPCESTGILNSANLSQLLSRKSPQTSNTTSKSNTTIAPNSNGVTTGEDKKKPKNKKTYNHKNGETQPANYTNNKTKIITHSNTPYDLSAIIGVTSLESTVSPHPALSST